MLTSNFVLLLKKKILFSYSWEIQRERERGRDTGRGRSRLPVRSLMWDLILDTGIMPWAEGRRLTTEPPREAHQFSLFLSFKILFIHFFRYINCGSYCNQLSVSISVLMVTDLSIISRWTYSLSLSIFLSFCVLISSLRAGPKQPWTLSDISTLPLSAPTYSSNNKCRKSAMSQR